jgi:hypothetical protein
MPFRTTLALRPLALLALAVLATGCLSPLKKQSADLATATTPVVEQASAAYRAANALYDTTVDYQAVRAFDRKQPVYNPREIGVLLPEKDLQIRLKVLQAFQLYVQNVVAITNGTDSPALQAASKSVGNNLTGLSNDLAPTIEASFGIATTTSSTASATAVTTTDATVTTAAGSSSAVTSATTTTATTTTSALPPPVTPAIRAGIATAADALGQFLVQRKIRRELPAIVEKMDPHLRTLCDLLESDIDILQNRERRDYDTLLDDETLFIRTSPTLSAEDRRNEIVKLPAIVRQQRQADQQLTTLRASIEKLYLTHHALATVAQGNNPESLKDKLGELEAAGGNLGTFYTSQAK